ncbi:hypothetical protein VTO73DRAFT_11883 [Trametes versicolor]
MTTEIFTPGAVYTLFNGHFGTVMEFCPSNGLVQAGDLRGGEALRAGSVPMVWHVARDVDSDMVRSDLKSELWYPSRCDLDSFLQEPVVGAHEESPHEQTTNDAPPDIASRGFPGPGALVLVNVKSNGVLALASESSVGQPVECKCYSRAITHKEHSEQLWTFIPSGAGFIVQSGALTADGQPLYLTIEGTTVAGAVLVAKPYPVSWEVRCYELDKTKTISYRVYWPGTDLVLSPETEGNRVDGTVVRLERCRIDGVHELWQAALP